MQISQMSLVCALGQERIFHSLYVSLFSIACFVR